MNSCAFDNLLRCAKGCQKYNLMTTHHKVLGARVYCIC